ncbi:ParB family protein [Sinomonas humi]|uniref:ParB family protein n=1 Tax=Sinomonas humi TaxID=1338436 RepID=UPI00068F44D1|nr:hypothetical protein [Sinomonas humi]
MAGRPERKRSALGAAHPIEARENILGPEATPMGAPGSSAASVPEPILHAVAVQEPAPASEATSTPIRKAGFYADLDTIARIRAAWYYTPPASGEREESLSDFLLAAALDRMEERQRKYNGGEEFPAVPAGKIARGRR